MAQKRKRLKLIPTVLFQTVFCTLLGLTAGFMYSFGGLLIDLLVSLEWITTDETPGLSYGTLLAFGALLGMPLIGALIGLVSGLVGTLVFNLFSKWLGWVNLNLG